MDIISLARPITDDRDQWKAYWTAQGEPWRTEPEVSEERQRELAERRDTIKPDIKQGIYPFKDFRLTRADIEWLLHEHGPIDWNNRNQRKLRGLDIRGAVLANLDLSHLPLAGLLAGLLPEEWDQVTPLQRDAVITSFEGTDFSHASLQGGMFNDSNFAKCRFFKTHAEQAIFIGAHLESADLIQGYFAGVDLRHAFFGSDAFLDDLQITHPEFGAIWIADIHWGDVNLAIIDWESMRQIGDELDARNHHYSSPAYLTRTYRENRNTRRDKFVDALRANRQIATALRGQGVNEQADRFAYRAQLCQRRVTRFDGLITLPAYLGSLLLDLISGYGYRPARSLVTYAFVIGVFGLIYTLLGQSTAHPLDIQEAIVISMTAFHGRGFFATSFSPGDPQALVAAIEAFVGLFIEVTFIATFTQRFFSR